MPQREAREKNRGRRGCLGGRISVLTTIVATVFVGGVWWLQRSPGEDWWFGTLLAYAPQVFWIIPLALALVVALVGGRRFLALVNLAVIVVVLFGMAGLQCHRPRRPSPAQQTIRVATWNLYGRTRQRELVRNRILSWNCDIVCLQESQGRVFADLLPGYESVLEADLRIYVRGRIVDHQAIDAGPYRPRVMLRVDAETRAGPVSVITLHFPRAIQSRSMPRAIAPLARYLESGVRVREDKFRYLMEAIPSGRPVIVAGDMNTPPTSRFWREVASRLTDAFDATGFGFGHTYVWRRKWALLRIDYIWTGGGITPLRCWTEPAYPSDHKPVIADVALPPVSDDIRNGR